MNESEYRCFVADWRFECGGPHRGPLFRAGDVVQCTPGRAAALDRRAVVERASKTKASVSFEGQVAAWRAAPEASGPAVPTENGASADDGSAPASSGGPDENDAGGGSDADAVADLAAADAGDDGGRKKSGGARKS